MHLHLHIGGKVETRIALNVFAYEFFFENIFVFT
jgi:hypothetical protein